jgi:hypothetical protein
LRDVSPAPFLPLDRIILCGIPLSYTHAHAQTRSAFISFCVYRVECENLPEEEEEPMQKAQDGVL